MTKVKVMTVCGDAGGAAAVAPVAALLRSEQRVQVRSAVYRQAVDVWTRHQLDHEVWPENLTDAQLKMMAGESDILLLGTSVNGLDYERRLGALFPDRSVAVLDFWSNYAARFQMPGGVLRQPALTCVMDEQARTDLVAEGFEAARLVVTGQPAFDELPRFRSDFTAEKVRAFRAGLGLKDGDLLVVFASQPLAELYERLELRARHPGYDQHSVLRLLVAELEALAQESKRGLFLLVRPHPRENSAALAWVEQHAGVLKTCVSGAGDSRACAVSADLVCGMTSVLLVESCYLGCPTVSVQPGLVGPDTLPSNRAGWSLLVREASEIRPVVRRLLFDPKARAEHRQRLEAVCPDGRAARRVADVVYRAGGLSVL